MGANAVEHQGRLAEQSEGDAAYARFEIDDELCTACGLCRERAPGNMDTPPGSHTASVVRQPASSEEESACREAAEYCPTGGILVEE